MNEDFNRFKNIIESVDEILIAQDTSQEIKASANALNKSVEPCMKEIQQSASRLNNFVQGCFKDLSHAEDVWHSKQRVSQISTHKVWEEIGDLSGRVFRFRHLGNKYKSETIKQVKISWNKRIKNLENTNFYSNKNKLKSSLNILEKDNLIKELKSELEAQLECIKLSLMQIADLIIKQEIQAQVSFIQMYVDQLDKKRKTTIKQNLNLITQSISNLIERAFRGDLHIIFKDLIDSVINSAEALSKQGVLGISMEQFTKCCDEIAIKLEKIVTVIFDELLRLVNQAIEQAIAFYNDFLQQQARYQQETPEQRQAEKAWIDQQRLQLAQVQSGIDAILQPVIE